MKLFLLLFSLLLSVSTTFSQGYQEDWSHLYSTTDSLSSFSNDIDPMGNTFVIGSALNINNNYDLIFLKYNDTGSLLWNKKINGGLGIDDYGKSVKCDILGNSYWLGTTNQNSIDKETVLYKYDPLGNIIWSFTSPT